jgi:hypothetical protein
MLLFFSGFSEGFAALEHFLNVFLAAEHFKSFQVLIFNVVTAQLGRLFSAAQQSCATLYLTVSAADAKPPSCALSLLMRHIPRFFRDYAFTFRAFYNSV